MNPLFIYIALFAVALVVCVVASVSARKPSRSCMSCGRDTPIDGRRCRHCGYRQGRV
jgi:ribosomal protein L40E